jgi:tetratricopeptide (TPR) repeat protein
MTWSRVFRSLLMALALAGSGTLRGEQRAPAPPAKAEVPEPATVRTTVPPDLHPAISLAHRAERLKQALQAGDELSLQNAILDVEALRRTYGTLDLLPLVQGMSLWAVDQGRQGRREVAVHTLDMLERWAEGHPILLSARIALKRQEGPQGYLSSLPEALTLSRQRLVNPAQRWLWLLQHLDWMRVMAVVLLWGWALTLVLRYRHVFRYQWEDGLERKGMSPLIVGLLGAFGLALPVVLGLDPSVAAILWVVLLVAFLTPGEVRATVFILALQFLHPILGLVEPLAAQPTVPSLLSVQLQPQVRRIDEGLAKVLDPLDAEFLKGWRAFQQQRWQEGTEVFRGLVGRHPDQGAVLNNLGVGLYQSGDKEGAGKRFDEAFMLEPRSAEILLNQSIRAFERLDTVLGEGKQGEARRVAGDAFQRLMSVNMARKEARTFPMPMPDTSSRLSALRSLFDGKQPNTWGTGLREPSILLGLLIPALGLGLFLYRVKQFQVLAHPTQCVRCGEPFHTTDSPDPNVCPKCHHLFVLKDGLHGESRRKKLDEVAEFQAWQKRIHQSLVVALPGADRIFLGETQDGLGELAFFTFAVALVFSAGRTVRYPGEILADPGSFLFPLGVALLLLLFVRSWMKLLPRRT